MKIKRAGQSKPTEFGACKTTQAVLRYAKLEGFPTAKATCVGCGFKWTMIITPSCNMQEFRKAIVPGQPCIKCGEEKVQARNIEKH